MGRAARAARSLEVWSGLALMGWGVWVRCDGASLIDLPSYDPISEFIPPFFWAYSTMLVGAAQVLARSHGGWILRVAGAFFAMLFFKVLAVSIMVSPTPGPNSMILCAMAFGNAAVAIGLFIPGVLAAVRRRHRAR